MIRVLLAVLALSLTSPAFAGGTECLPCFNNLKKTLQGCASEDGEAQASCREEAFNKAKACERKAGGNCNLDTLMQIEERKIEEPEG